MYCELISKYIYMEETSFFYLKPFIILQIKLQRGDSSKTVPINMFGDAK